MQQNNGSGVHHIIDSNDIQYPVYCDMDINGGGWTLVSTVHENNLESTGRCTVGDKWSSEQGRTPTRPEGDGNWMNRNIFGHVTAATSDDYKNPGYFEITARDVMIWQVPNSTPLKNFSESAYLKYRTSSHFLDRYGGNLHYLYKNHFPIRSGAYSFPSHGPNEPVVFDKGNADEVLKHFPPNARPHLEPGFIQVFYCKKTLENYTLFSFIKDPTSNPKFYMKCKAPNP